MKLMLATLTNRHLLLGHTKGKGGGYCVHQGSSLVVDQPITRVWED